LSPCGGGPAGQYRGATAFRAFWPADDHRGALIAGGGCVGLFGIARYAGYAAMAMQLVAWAAVWDFWFLRAPPRRSAV
jgi:hypothetical protein